MKNNKLPNKDIFDTSFVNPEDVILSEDKKTITIINTKKDFDYTLYNVQTGEQASDWINGSKGIVEFTNLNPDCKYAIRVKIAEEKSNLVFRYIRTLPCTDHNND